MGKVRRKIRGRGVLNVWFLVLGSQGSGEGDGSYSSVFAVHLISPVARPAGDLQPPLHPAPLHLGLSGSQDQPCNLWGPVQNENAEPLVQNVFRIP